MEDITWGGFCCLFPSVGIFISSSFVLNHHESFCILLCFTFGYIIRGIKRLVVKEMTILTPLLAYEGKVFIIKGLDPFCISQGEVDKFQNGLRYIHIDTNKGIRGISFSFSDIEYFNKTTKGITDSLQSYILPKFLR